MSLEAVFLQYSSDKLGQLCGRVETCLDKLTPEQEEYLAGWSEGT